MGAEYLTTLVRTSDVLSGDMGLWVVRDITKDGAKFVEEWVKEDVERTLRDKLSWGTAEGTSEDIPIIPVDDTHIIEVDVTVRITKRKKPKKSKDTPASSTRRAAG